MEEDYGNGEGEGEVEVEVEVEGEQKMDSFLTRTTNQLGRTVQKRIGTDIKKKKERGDEKRASGREKREIEREKGTTPEKGVTKENRLSLQSTFSIEISGEEGEEEGGKKRDEES